MFASASATAATTSTTTTEATLTTTTTTATTATTDSMNPSIDADHPSPDNNNVSADEKDEDSDARRVRDDEDDDVQERRVAPGYLKSSLATHAPILFNPLNLTEGTRDNQMKASVAASSVTTKSSLAGNNKQFAGSNLLISSNHNINHNINYNINSFNKNNNSNNFFTQQNTSFAFYSLFNQHLIKQQMQQQQRLQQQIISDPSNNNNNNIVSKSGNNFVGNDVNSIVNTSDISDSNNTTYNNINDINNNININNNNSINNHMQLSHSYNCLAKQLHDTERHVIQLRKALSCMRNKLSESKNMEGLFRSELFKGTGSEGQQKESLSSAGHHHHSHSLTDILNDNKDDLNDEDDNEEDDDRDGTHDNADENEPTKPDKTSEQHSPAGRQQTYSATAASSSSSSSASSSALSPCYRRMCNVDDLMSKIEMKLNGRADYEAIKRAILQAIDENNNRITTSTAAAAPATNQTFLDFNNNVYANNKNSTTNEAVDRNQQQEISHYTGRGEPISTNVTNNNFMISLLPNYCRFNANRNIFLPHLASPLFHPAKLAMNIPTFQNLDSTFSAFNNQNHENLLNGYNMSKKVTLERGVSVKCDDNVNFKSHHNNSFNDMDVISKYETIRSSNSSHCHSTIEDPSLNDDVDSTQSSLNRISIRSNINNNDDMKNNSSSKEMYNLNSNNGTNHGAWAFSSPQRTTDDIMNNNSDAIIAPRDASVYGATQSLDTSEVAQRIREILSAHNIGQRLFARHVLGLSQGTVSELLSKPKHWDKLTEKGRESYRRMHLWASDENNITTLKSFAPKKGSSMPTSNSEVDDAETEEKIAQILSEAKLQMQMKNNGLMSNTASAMVANIYYQELSRYNQTKRFHKAGDGNRDIVAQIYQDELKKLASKAEIEGNEEDADLYKREISRINEVINQNNPLTSCSSDQYNSAAATELTDNKENSFNFLSEPDNLYNVIKIEPTLHSENMKTLESREKPESFEATNVGIREESFPQDLRTNRPIGSSFDALDIAKSTKTVYPHNFTQHYSNNHLNRHTKCKENGNVVSPLQQMQSIASSLLIKSQRPLRAVLPPISQEQLDIYSEIETEELVKKVKDLLSQYSISQRLFGEMVLGLSQGSVSDLLARPKPWLMLTQKGREPFIRMQIFLDDQTAVSKLVAAQFQSPAEKLMKLTGSNNIENKSASTLNSASNQISSVISPVASCKYPNFINQMSNSYRSSKLASGPSTPYISKQNIDSFLDKPIKFEQQYDVNNEYLKQASFETGNAAPHNIFLSRTPQYPINFYHPNVMMRLPQFGHSAENDYMAPNNVNKNVENNQELDTFEITTKVKEVLQFHNLGQKLFGEAVLGLSQGSVSELLSKPKPWHMLSLKGREPFLKMHLWLLDPLSISRLKMYQDQIRTKKRKSIDDHNLTDSQQKKTRIFFSEEQKHSLRQAYAADPYPSQATLDELAAGLGVATKTVVNWFHNYRMRAKQQMKTTIIASANGTTQENFERKLSDMFTYCSDDENMDSEITVDDETSCGCLTTNFSPEMNQTNVESSPPKHDSNECENKIEQEDEDDEKTPDESSRANENVYSVPSSPKQQCSNKRKSAKPQWVYEGTQLLRNLYESETAKSYDFNETDAKINSV